MKSSQYDKYEKLHFKYTKGSMQQTGNIRTKWQKTFSCSVNVNMWNS